MKRILPCKLMSWEVNLTTKNTSSAGEPRIDELLGDAQNSMPWALIQRQQPRPACLGTRWTRVITPPVASYFELV